MNWKILIFGSILLPLLVSMGFWQLQRAAEKDSALASYTQQLTAAPGGWTELSAAPDRYQKFQLSGHYQMDSDWLLDNQIHKGQFGYRVFTPFCENIRCVLVDRGWVKGDLNRQTLPSIKKITGVRLISGRADQLSQNPMTGKNERLTTSPFRVQKIELDIIKLNSGKVQTPKRLVSWVLRLEDGQPGHYDITWKPVVTGPEKHYGYAVQWFTMAFALIILLIFFALKHRQQ